jgi:RHS repeat-associated protein
MRGTTQKVVTATLAFVLATQSLWTYAQTGNRTRLRSPAEIQPAQTVPPSEPSANWPEVTERIQAVQAGDATLEAPQIEALKPLADTANEPPLRLSPDLVLAAPAAQVNTPQRAIALSAQVNQVTLQGKAQFIPSPSMHGQIDGGNVSPLGVQFKIAFDAGAQTALSSSGQPLRLALDYSAVELPAIDDLPARMVVFIGTGCAFDAQGALTTCAAMTPLTTTIDVQQREAMAEIDNSALALLSGSVTLTQTGSAPAAPTADATRLLRKIFVPMLSASAAAEKPPQTTDRNAVVILGVGTGSVEGDYGATPLGDVGDYQAGLFGGSGALNYAIPVPPAAAGPAPDVSLNYDSGSVDGFAGNKNSQPSWVGLGWQLGGGSIKRLYKTCSTSQASLCFTNADGVYALSLNGISSNLVKVSSGTGVTTWTLQDDPRWKVEKFTNGPAAHPDYNKEVWWVTTPDGTRYRFGGEIEPETGTDQESVFWVPVFKDSNNPCTGSADSVCNRAWQWNLDRVEDTNGNVVSYFYDQEFNWFNSNGSGNIRKYVRAGAPSRIEYSKRSGTAVQPHARVVFNTQMRCVDPTTIAGCDSTTADYFDTPNDQSCTPTSCSTARKSPSFWSQRRLHTVLTQVYDPGTTRWKTAGVWELSQSWPQPPADQFGNASVRKMWLDSITRRPGDDFTWTAYTQIEAEKHDAMQGASITETLDAGRGSQISSIDNGDWIRFNSVNFDAGASKMLLRISTSAATNVSVRLDSPTGPQIGAFSIANLSNAWQTFEQPMTGASGIRDVYLVFGASAANVASVNWLRFVPAGALPGLPAATFGHRMLANRKDCAASVTCQLMPRVMTMTNEIGGMVELTYGQSHSCPALSGSQYTRIQFDCFPSSFVTSGGLSGSVLFHKYKVLARKAWGNFSGNPVQTVNYAYTQPIFAWYDDPTTNDDYWNDFRGHKIVTETLPNGVKIEHRFFRGMQGDRLNASGGTFNDNITLSDGTVLVDNVWLKGKKAETRTLSSSGALLQRSVTTYMNTLTAGSGVTGAYFVAPQTVVATDYGTVNKTTQTDSSYDSYGNVTAQVLYGDTSTAADDRNVQRAYAYNPSAYIVDTLQSERLCAGTANCAAGSELSMREYAYDNLGIGAAPTKGNLTLVRSHAQRTPAAVFYDTSTAYDAYGRPTSVTDPLNRTTSTAYHPFYGYAQLVTNALNHTVSTVSDPRWGVPLSVTDADNQVTTLQYDGYGRRTAVWLPTEPTSGPASAEYVYNVAARPAWVQTRQLMTPATSTYLESWTYVDGFGRDIQTQRGDATASRVLTSKAYNALGQLLYASTPYAATGTPGSGYLQPAWTSLSNYGYFEYDPLGRQNLAQTRSGASALWSAVTVFDGWQTRAYDARGGTSPLGGNRTDYTYDAFDQLAGVTEYKSVSGATQTYNTSYSYDLRGGTSPSGGNLTGVTDAAGNVTSITYDLLGRKTGMTDPDMGNWAYGYDAAGNLISQRDARGWWLYLEYDGLNRLIRKRRDATNGPVLAEWTYDTLKKGMLSSSVAYTGLGNVQVSALGYDARNRATAQQWSIPTQGVFRFDYTYDAANNLISTRYPGGNAGQQGEIVTRSYLPQTGQLGSVVSDDGTRFVDYTLYNPAGQLTEQRHDSGANGLTRRITYDPNTLRTSRLYAGSGGQSANLLDLNVSYDSNGNITSLIDNVNSAQKQCFGYDWLNRLTGAFTGDAGCSSFVNSGIGAYNHTYVYNAIGNITSNAGNSYVYGSGKPHAVTAAFGNVYGYDANGNQTSRTIGGVTYDFTFDYDNRITEVKQGATTLGSFVYDADGNRVLGTVNGVATAYIAGLYEYQNGATTKYYDTGAMRRSGYGANNGISYVLGDQLGSSSKIVGQNGALQASNYFLPFGGNRGGSAFSDLTTKRFTGQYHESGLPGGEGLSFYNARWYDAQLGRFVSPDSLVPGANNPQHLNRLSYVGNNPINRTDPTGHYEACDDGPCRGHGDNRNGVPIRHPWPRPTQPSQGKTAYRLPSGGSNRVAAGPTGQTSVPFWDWLWCLITNCTSANTSSVPASPTAAALLGASTAQPKTTQTPIPTNEAPEQITTTVVVYRYFDPDATSPSSFKRRPGKDDDGWSVFETPSSDPDKMSLPLRVEYEGDKPYQEYRARVYLGAQLVGTAAWTPNDRIDHWSLLFPVPDNLVNETFSKLAKEFRKLTK